MVCGHCVKVHHFVSRRIEHEINRRILEPFYTRNDFWWLGFGSFLAREQNFAKVPFSGSSFIVFESMFDREGIEYYKPLEPLIRDFWLPDLQVMGARDKNGSDEGFFFAAKGGHNAESHNHNDVGSFVLYYDGQPVLIDAGVGTYTAQTFSAQRYDIWTMQSAYHNLPTINATMQQAGKNFAASGVRYMAADKKVKFSLDIAGAYPEKAQVSSWIRAYILNRGKGLAIADKYQLNSFKESFTYTFLSAVEPKISQKGTIELSLGSGKKLFLTYKDSAFNTRIEPIEQTDSRLKSSWGEKLYRILLVSKSTELRGETLVEITR